MARRKKVDISQEEIAARAFLLFEQRGGEHGRDQDDWFQAERELRLEKEAERVNSALSTAFKE